MRFYSSENSGTYLIYLIRHFCSDELTVLRRRSANFFVYALPTSAIAVHYLRAIAFYNTGGEVTVFVGYGADRWLAIFQHLHYIAFAIIFEHVHIKTVMVLYT